MNLVNLSYILVRMRGSHFNVTVGVFAIIYSVSKVGAVRLRDRARQRRAESQGIPMVLKTATVSNACRSTFLGYKINLAITLSALFSTAHTKIVWANDFRYSRTCLIRPL